MPSEVPGHVLPRALREVLSPRVVRDLRLKVQVIAKVPQARLDALFGDMCDAGLSAALEAGRRRFPGKTDTEIMKRLYRLQSRLKRGK